MEVLYITSDTLTFAQHAVDPCVLALGFFDGVHLGHQQIIQTAKKKANEMNMPLAVMTFTPHPSKIIKPDHAIEHFLTPIPVKQRILSDLGVEKMYFVEFDQEFARLPHEEFVHQYICGLKCRHVVAGFDFTYGFRGIGNMTTIVDDGQGEFSATTVEKLEFNQQKIGSTQIRELLDKGFVEEIPGLLGEYYGVDGLVERSLFPNVENVLVDKEYKLPKSGYYKVSAEFGEVELEGICYVSKQSITQRQTILIRFTNSVTKGKYEERMSIRWIRHVENEQVERQFHKCRQALVI